MTEPESYSVAMWALEKGTWYRVCHHELVNGMNSSIVNNIGKILLVVFSFALISGCNEEWVSISRVETLIIGVSTDYRPFEFIKNGKIIGFDIDLANYVGKKLKKNVKLRDMPFSELIGSLKAQEVDMVISAMSVDEKREQYVDFSNPYYITKLVLLLRSDSQFPGLDALHDAAVGVIIGTTLENFIENYSHSHNINMKIVRFQNYVGAMAELNDKKIDAIVVEQAQAIHFVREGHYKFIFQQINGYGVDSYAVALPKNSILLDEVNEILEEMMENGTLDEMKKKWLE
ncbi:polar amino acid transport system substrate-binding protein [Alphaproteobacteria bacterium]